MARTPVRPRPPASPAVQPHADLAGARRRRRRRPLRFWYVPLLLAVLLPLVFWAAVNGAVVIVANRDLGSFVAPPEVAPTPVPDQPLLDGAIALVQSFPCAPASGSIQAQPGIVGTVWTARRSEADSHAYYVAAADPVTERLLGIWQVEGGQVLRLQDDHCLGIPAGPPARLAEAAVLFSPHRAGSGMGQ